MMTNAVAANWIEKLPLRWARNGALVGLIWMASAIIFAGSSPRTLTGALVLAGFIGVLALLGWLFGLGARRRLRRVLALDDKSARQAVIWLPARYALVGAAIGLLFPLADLALRWRAGEVAFGDGEKLAYAIGMPIMAAIAGAFIGVITCDQIRRRLAGRS